MIDNIRESMVKVQNEYGHIPVKIEVSSQLMVKLKQAPVEYVVEVVVEGNWFKGVRIEEDLTLSGSEYRLIYESGAKKLYGKRE